jgi:hypothetical protein
MSSSQQRWNRPARARVGTISEVRADGANSSSLVTTDFHKSGEARAHRDAHKRSARTEQRIIDEHIANATGIKSRFRHSPVKILRQLSDTPDWVVDHPDFFHVSSTEKTCNFWTVRFFVFMA